MNHADARNELGSIDAHDPGPGPEPGDPLDEATRRRPGRMSGIAVELADGARWWMPRVRHVRQADPTVMTTPVDAELLDRFWEAGMVDGVYNRPLVEEAAALLLTAHYRLDAGEVLDLLTLDPEGWQAMGSAVERCMLGDDVGEVGRGYSDWVRSAMIANNISILDAVDVPNVMAVLVATGRTVPLEKFADAARDRAQRQELAALGGPPGG